MIVEFDGFRPRIAEDAFIAPTATLIGNVVVGSGASVWYGAVLRGDHGEQAIVIGPGSNVQDNAVIHVSLERGTTVGANVTVGHGCVLEACEVSDGAVIGMNSTVLEHARIGARSMVGAGSTVLPHTDIPAEVLAAGSPAAVKKALDGDARWWIEKSSTYYRDLACRYLAQGLSQALPTAEH